jgi:signal transduction histidine kinase
MILDEQGVARKFPFMEDGGEMGRLTREFDWASSPLGPIETWPAALRTSVSILLHSGFPMLLWWGDDMIQFYNDAFRPSLGQDGKHPKALGEKAIESWSEVWGTQGPLIESIKRTRKSIFAEDQLIPIYRNGKIEDVYWTYSYSAIIGEHGDVEGIFIVATDTTEKVNNLVEMTKAQEIQAFSEANFKNIILQAPVAMAIFKGPNHIVEIANERMFRLWGKPGHEFISKPIFDVLLDAKKEGFEDLLTSVFTSGQTYTAYAAPVTLYRGDTTELVYVHFVYEAFRDSNGIVSGVMAVAVEVTAEVVARKKLEESQDRVKALVESAPFPIGVYAGEDMVIEIVNQSIIDVWGKGADLIGKRYADILPELEGQQIIPQLQHVYKTGVPFHARNQRVDLLFDGKLQPFYFNYSFTPLFDKSGKVYGVMNTAAEVTDLVVAKQQVELSERNFRNMVKQAPVAMCIMLGPEHVVDVANDLIIELWGKPAGQVMNKPIFEGLPDARGQGLEKLLHDVYHTGVPFTASEMAVQLIRSGKPQTIYQNFVYEPYRDPDGTILGVLAITVDVTAQVVARQKIEEIVKERTESLRQSNAELTQFAYITSHDLQEPARKISTFIDMLENSLGNDINEKSKLYLSKINSASERMLMLIRDILAISQLSKTAVVYERVDLNETLAEILKDFELLIEQKGCVVENETLPTIDAIPVQMNQLFSNLISNAIKFTRDGTKLCLNIKCGVADSSIRREFPNLRPSSRYFVISFIDNGIGFNQSNADQIFNIFQRLHTRQEYEGTGMGLAMCKKIAENHGGHIHAKSSPGEGATFTVILPVTQDGR